MKYIKYLIFILIVLIIIIISVILSLMNIDKNEDGKNQVGSFDTAEETLKVIKMVSDRNEYYIARNITQEYYDDLLQFNKTDEEIIGYGYELSPENATEQLTEEERNELIEENKKTYREIVYNKLSKNYIKKNNITKDNLQEKLGNYNNAKTIINNMYYAKMKNNLTIFFVEGEIINTNNYEKNNFSIMILLDSENYTFEIYPETTGYDITLGKEINIEVENIEKNEYNKYSSKSVSDEIYCRDIVQDLKNRIMYDINNAYNCIEEEYRNKKFGSVEQFENIINENKTRYLGFIVNQYSYIQKEDCTQILCVDKNNNYYIFYEVAPMKYTVILDTYTIDIPEFLEKYNESNTQERIILNLNKFMLALNDKDYKYAYSIIAESFKENNFKTEEEFENYAKQNFFTKNKFEYLRYGTEANTYYTYEVKITDSTGKSNEELTKTFIVLLKNGTDFELSFNI